MPDTPMFEPFSMQEVVRQEVHTRLMIKAAGLLPDVVDPSLVSRVLDIGCGPGAWLRELSYAYPDILLVGTDSSPDMIKDAAVSNIRRGFISFHVWDPLTDEENPFPPTARFDLIRLNLASRWITEKVSWLRLFYTCYQYLRRGGVLLVIENDGFATTSPALDHLDEVLHAAHKMTGRSLGGTTYHGMMLALMTLLKSAHFPKPQVVAASVDFSYTYEEENYAWRDYFRMLIQEMSPYLTGAGVATPEELYELSIRLDGEMFREEFCGIWSMYTLVAHKV